jgi:hypothetical protein
MEHGFPAIICIEQYLRRRGLSNEDIELRVSCLLLRARKAHRALERGDSAEEADRPQDSRKDGT